MKSIQQDFILKKGKKVPVGTVSGNYKKFGEGDWRKVGKDKKKETKKNDTTKVKKRFDYKGVEMRIVEREEPYMNSPDPITVKRVLAPNGKSLPISIQRKESLKSIQERAISMLKDFEERGENVIKELTT